MSAVLFSVQFSIVLGCIAITTNGFFTIKFIASVNKNVKIGTYKYKIVY